MSSDVVVGKYSLHILRRIFFLMDHAWSWQTLASRPLECFIGTSLGSPRNKSTPLDPSPRNHSTRGICSPGSAIHWRIMDRCHTTTSTTNKRLQNHRSSGISCYMSDAENMEKRVGSPGAGGKNKVILCDVQRQCTRVETLKLCGLCGDVVYRNAQFTGRFYGFVDLVRLCVSGDVAPWFPRFHAFPERLRDLLQIPRIILSGVENNCIGSRVDFI